MSIFKTRLEFDQFYEETRSNRRYIYSKRVNRFLSGFREAVKKNYIQIDKDNILYRAQKGVNEETNSYTKECKAFDAKRMVPIWGKAKEGRINPKGIPYLYLADNKRITLYEVNPWKGEKVSLARFRVRTKLKMVYFNFYLKYYENQVYQVERKKDIDTQVWNKINIAFSKPVLDSDFNADYVPTQILAEIIKDEGFDGIMYTSQYGEYYNYCLFNLLDAEFLDSEIVTIKNIKLQI
jgi:hypothetical protein